MLTDGQVLKKPVSRDIGFDLIRMMASIMVVVIHVSASGFYRFEADWLASNLYGSLSRSAVPLFFMLSGALLVPRDSDLPSVIRRALKMTIPLVFGSYFYLLWWTYNHAQPSPDLNPLSLLKGPVVFHLWFFYTLFGVYLFLPLLQGLYRKSKALQIFYLLMVFITVSVIPSLNGIGIPLVIGFDLQYFAQYAGYTFAGAVLGSIIPSPKQTIVAMAMGILFSAVTALWTWQLSISAAAASEQVYVYHAPLVVLAALAFFLAFRGIGLKFFSKSAATPIHFVAQNAVGIFIFHMFVIDHVYVRGLAPNFIDQWMGIPITVLIVWSISLAMSAAIRALPFGKFLLP